MNNCSGVESVFKLDAGVVESPVGYNWSVTDSGLTSKLMTQTAAPKELIKLTMCPCLSN